MIDWPLIDTVYGWFPLAGLVLAGAVTAYKKRDRWNWYVLACLGAYYVAYLLAQEIAGTNSPAGISLFMAVLTGIAIAASAVRTKTHWPLLVSVILLLSAMLDIVYSTTAGAGGSPSWERDYQDAGALLWFSALMVYLIHPSLRRFRPRDVISWRYA